MNANVHRSIHIPVIVLATLNVFGDLVIKLATRNTDVPSVVHSCKITTNMSARTLA